MGRFTADEPAPTLKRLLEASFLAPRAYTDQAVSSAAGSASGIVSALAECGPYLTAEVAGESSPFVGGAACTTSAATAARVC